MPRKYQKKQSMGKRLVKAGKYAWKHRSTAVKAYQLATKVARMVNVEYKIHDTVLSQNQNNVLTIIPLSESIPIGDDYNQREGDGIKLIRLSGRVWVTQNSSAQKTAFRIIFFYAKYQNGNTFSPAELLQTGNDFLSPKARETRFGSKIIYDKLYHMSNNGNSSLLLNYNFKLFGHAQWQLNSNNPQSGQLYMGIISNEPTNQPVFNCFLRTSFTDN